MLSLSLSILTSLNTCYPCFYFLVPLLLLFVTLVICYHCCYPINIKISQYLLSLLLFVLFVTFVIWYPVVTLVTFCPCLLFPVPIVTCCHPYCYLLLSLLLRYPYFRFYLLALLFLIPVSISYLLVLLLTIPVVTHVICYPCCYPININTKLVLLEHFKVDYFNIGILLYKLVNWFRLS